MRQWGKHVCSSPSHAPASQYSDGHDLKESEWAYASSLNGSTSEADPRKATTATTCSAQSLWSKIVVLSSRHWSVLDPTAAASVQTKRKEAGVSGLHMSTLYTLKIGRWTSPINGCSIPIRSDNFLLPPESNVGHCPLATHVCKGFWHIMTLMKTHVTMDALDACKCLSSGWILSECASSVSRCWYCRCSILQVAKYIRNCKPVEVTVSAAGMHCELTLCRLKDAKRC